MDDELREYLAENPAAMLSSLPDVGMATKVKPSATSTLAPSEPVYTAVTHKKDVPVFRPQARMTAVQTKKDVPSVRQDPATTHPETGVHEGGRSRYAPATSSSSLPPRESNEDAGSRGQTPVFVPDVIPGPPPSDAMPATNNSNWVPTSHLPPPPARPPAPPPDAENGFTVQRSGGSGTVFLVGAGVLALAIVWMMNEGSK